MLIYRDFLATSTHAHNYITRSLDSLHPNEQVYMHFNIKRVEKVVLRRKKAKIGQNALFHLLQNAPTPALIYHDFLPTSTHAHNYITRSLDSLHPNEQVYLYFNIKRVEKVVLRREKAKMGKRTVSFASKCAYTCADLPRFSRNFNTCAQLYHPIFG